MEQGLLFDVEYYEKLNSKLKDDEKKKEAYELASEVQLPFYESPVNDNEKLFNYQYAWYKQNNYEARQQMFLLGYKVLQRLLWSYLKKKKCYIDEERQTEIVHCAFEYVFRRFDKGYYVTKNFIVVLKDGLRHALFYRTSANDELSLDLFKKDFSSRVNRWF